MEEKKSNYEKLSTYKMPCVVTFRKNKDTGSIYPNYEIVFDKYSISLQAKSYSKNDVTLLKEYCENNVKK